jgi:RND family efflux transporter MFP subunit
VRAPADGIILTRNVEVGQTATPGGEALFRLSEGGEVELRGQVSEQDLPLLKVGQLVNVRLTGTPRVYEGHVRLLGAVIDPQTRLGMARVALTPDPNLRPGAFARAEVTVSNADRAVLPQTAVLTDDKGSYVLIVSAQHKVERRAVHVSGVVQNGVTIADGINGKEQVVATAGAFLQEGELVNPVLKEPGRL